MTRVTPLRLTTLQCSQIGFTLVRTFTKTSSYFDAEMGAVQKQPLTVAAAST
jgi:hypothetical protein